MSDSIDANLLIYASDTFSPEQSAAFALLPACAEDPDLMCLTWSTVMAYQWMVTHPSHFFKPHDPWAAWKNIQSLLALPRTRIITEEPGFADNYLTVTDGIIARGNLVPDAHIATVFRQHGVRWIYTADTDFRKFSFLEGIHPLR